MKYFFTSATESYLPNARILARSVKRHHPDAQFILLFNDIEDNTVNWAIEPFDDVLYAHKMGVPNFYNLVFRYSVIEFCTAVKGYAAKYILEHHGAESVIYLDPDTEVFSPLNELFGLLESHDTILTPHITDVNETEDGIESHEIAALKHGTFNLGFFAIKHSTNGLAFLNWWSDRLLRFSDIDFNRGLFTDQKWANLAPYLFEGVHVLTKRTYNIATWNMNNRQLTRDDADHWLVNGERLQFYHFSGFGFGFGWADRELAMFRQGDRTREIWDLYKQKYADETVEEVAKITWYWSRFSNGVEITASDRTRAKMTKGTDTPLCFRETKGYQHLRCNTQLAT